MTEEEKLIRAKLYADKLASGIDPISNRALPSDSTLNQPRMLRYFSYISEIINEKICQEFDIDSTSITRLKFDITQQALDSILVSDEPIPISNLARRISAKSKPGSKHFSHRWATNWLVLKGYLFVHEESGKRIPTTSGTKLGIFQDHRSSAYGSLLVTLYRKEAQQYILDHLAEILKHESIFVDIH